MPGYKAVVLSVVCQKCLQDKECVGTSSGEWLCEDCAKRYEFPKKSDTLVQAGWVQNMEIGKKRLFKVEVNVCISRTYEIEADNEDDARENYQDGDLVNEDEDYEDIDSVKLAVLD